MKISLQLCFTELLFWSSDKIAAVTTFYINDIRYKKPILIYIETQTIVIKFNKELFDIWPLRLF